MCEYSIKDITSKLKLVFCFDLLVLVFDEYSKYLESQEKMGNGVKKWVTNKPFKIKQN